jgi:hypothetical protein
VDFEEVFAYVAWMESIRVMLAVVAHYGWTVHHMDVKSTFLNGDFTTEVYVQQPPGFAANGHEKKVLMLHKALYELRQALRGWNSKLDAVLHELDISRYKSEHAPTPRVKKKMRLVVGVYVDDLITMGELEEVEMFKEEMKKVF